MNGNGRARRRWLYLVLLVPFVALLWVPFYARETPKVWGIPFFYWYQFAWVIVTAALLAFVYVATRVPRGDRP
ncbi:MAG: DUF3311 domain-containing protein [Thermoleophilaceae bacterium]